MTIAEAYLKHSIDRSSVTNRQVYNWQIPLPQLREQHWESLKHDIPKVLRKQVGACSGAGVGCGEDAGRAGDGASGLGAGVGRGGDGTGAGVRARVGAGPGGEEVGRVTITIVLL